MKKIIFVDLDETLIHTFMANWGETPTKDAEEVILNTDGATDIYNTVLRQGAIYFLEVLRKAGNVYMLTAATTDYANAMNQHFGLGFTEKEIYAREDTRAGVADPEFFGTGKVYLFDNLPRHDNRTKIDFLKPLGELKYVQVQDFYNNKYGAFTHADIEGLVSNIVD